MRNGRAHGAFLDASIDSASLVGVSPDASAAPRFRGEHAALAVGGILEGSLRSLSNMLERLHHSSAFFILLSPIRFVAAPGFMPQVGVLLAALLLQACALATREQKEWGGAPGAGDWAHAAVVMAGVHCACAISRAWLARMHRSGGDALPLLTACVTAVCVAIPHVPALVPSAARRRAARPRAWVPLKIIMLLALLLWLARALVVCYALSLAGALFLVPMCLAARPRAPTDSRPRTAARWLPLLAASPPVVAFALHTWLGTTDLLRLLADDWRQWDSLLLPFLFGAYLPCFAVCVALLLA
jgi:glycosylphosphatidylinositol transamidase